MSDLIFVRRGAVWQDKDPRSPSRVVVLDVKGNGVRIQRASRKVTVRLDRFVRRFRYIGNGAA